MITGINIYKFQQQSQFNILIVLFTIKTTKQYHNKIKQQQMYNRLHNLFKASSKAILPLFSLTVLNIYKRQIFNKVHESLIPSNNTQTQIQNYNNKQNWNWQRIKQIDSPTELSEQDIRNKTIICYQMTGKPEIDSEVALLAHAFCDKYFEKISSPYQFVFLTPSPNPNHFYEDEQALFVVFGKEQSKYISLKKYLPSASLNNKTKQTYILNLKPLFKRILESVNQFEELNLMNLYEHLQHLNCAGRDTYQLLVLSENYSVQQINKSKQVLSKFLKNKQIWNSQIIKGIVADEQTRTILGLNRENVQTNNVYLIAPLNENLININETNLFRIGNKKYSIIKDDQIPAKFIFTPIPPKLSHSDYILKVNIDLNQTKPDQVSRIYSQMNDKQISNIPKLLNFQKSIQPIEIVIQKNNYDDIVNSYSQNCMYDNESKKSLLFHSNIWKYPHAKLSEDKLREFVRIVTSQEQNNKKQQLQFYRSQPATESVKKNSKLIVGEERKQTCQRKANKIIFHYSKNCHSCKRFSGLYEEVATEQKDLQFYRIDNDRNRTEGLRNYNSTPIFVMYKKQYPNLEWHFKMLYFTKTLFKDFIEITKQINVMDSIKLSNHINQHINNQTLVKDTLKEFL